MFFFWFRRLLFRHFYVQDVNLNWFSLCFSGSVCVSQYTAYDLCMKNARSLPKKREFFMTLFHSKPKMRGKNFSCLFFPSVFSLNIKILAVAQTIFPEMENSKGQTQEGTKLIKKNRKQIIFNCHLDFSDSYCLFSVPFDCCFSCKRKIV